MSYTPCCERRFLLRMASEFEYQYRDYLHSLKHLLERLGREHSLTLWADALHEYDEALLLHILSAGWKKARETETEDVEQNIADLAAELFPLPVEGVSREEAQNTVDSTPPFRQIRQHLPSLNVERKSTTYEALHLFRDGLARLTETLIERYGKQGELIAYDAMLEKWPVSQEPRMCVEEFMSNRKARFSSEPDEPNIFSAGLEVEFIRASETEVVTRVTECEWARYYQEHHPRVGYLLACSLDNAAYQSFNDRIRLQRTSTLMEGGTECDFRVYAVE